MEAGAEAPHLEAGFGMRIKISRHRLQKGVVVNRATPKWISLANGNKMKHRPAVPWWYHFDPCPIPFGRFVEMESTQEGVYRSGHVIGAIGEAWARDPRVSCFCWGALGPL